MACPRYFQSTRFGRAGASRPSLPLQFYLLWFPIKLLSSELLLPASKSSSFRRRLEVGKGGLPPLLSKHAIRKSGGKPPFLTSTILLALVSHRALELGTLITSIKVEFISKKIRGREGWLAPATLKARDSEERGQAALPYLYNSTCSGFP